jgi:hypothetical protein
MPNDLAPITGSTLSAISSSMSGRLWTLLSSNLDATTEVEEIAADPALKAEAKAVCTALAQIACAAGESAVQEALKPLVLVYGVGEAARSPAFWQAYKIMAGLPWEALRLGVEDYLAQPDSEFFPKPGPLKALCDKHAEPIYKAAFRASRAAALPPPRYRPPPTEAEKAAVARMLAEFRQSTADKSPARLRPALPSIAGKPDAGGLTPQMRDLMARRANGR